MPLLSTPSFPERGTLWRMRRPVEGALNALERAGSFPRPLAGILAARGIRSAVEAREFLEPPSGHDPQLLLGMAAAVERLCEAWRGRQKVAIFGDYDVDGVTSTVLLSKLFTLLGMAHQAYIPNRQSEGYGPNAPALLALKAAGASVVVTVDCGITSLAEALVARELGLDLIVTDHHVPGPELPAALAVVNPKTSPSYPYAHLAGVGVAYKLADALLRALEHPRRGDFLDHMLELVALGTVCDVAPLDGENRVFTRLGLERLRQGRWMGLRCLAKAAGVDLKEADAGTLGFHLGPRLNAGGRIGDAMLGVRLLLSKDLSEAAKLAERLDALNRERRGLEKSVVDEALDRAAREISVGARALVLWDSTWHSGVVGLAASRLLERFQVPVFVFAVDGGCAKGSGRSRAPYDLAACLQACSGHLLKFGGHAVAAGATAIPDALPAFAKAFAAAVDAYGAQDSRRILEVDLEVGFEDINERWMGPLAAMEPHGSANPRPCFMARRLTIGPGTRPVGGEGLHLKVELKKGVCAFQGIAFRQGSRAEELARFPFVDALFHLGWNQWQGRRSLQLEVRDLRPSD